MPGMYPNSPLQHHDPTPPVAPQLEQHQHPYVYPLNPIEEDEDRTPSVAPSSAKHVYRPPRTPGAPCVDRRISAPPPVQERRNLFGTVVSEGVGRDDPFGPPIAQPAVRGQSSRKSKKPEHLGSAPLAAEEPQTYQEAMDSVDRDKWIVAIHEEQSSIEDKGTWEVFNEKDLPLGRKAISSRCIINVNLNADGSVERYKARLICKGYSQVEGIDYDETFAPVSRYDSFRLLITLAAHFRYRLHQIDIKTAFLHGELDEEIWMIPPPGIGLAGKVLRLQKALYGLKQAPLKWFEKLSSVLNQKGFSNSHFDPCLFLHHEKRTFILVYVEDITLTGTRNEFFDEVLQHLKEYFTVSDKGPLSYMLGIENRDQRNRRQHTTQADKIHLRNPYKIWNG